MKLKTILLFAVLAFSASVRAQTNIYLRTTGPVVKGEVTAPGWVDSWQILSFSEGVSRPVTIMPGGGGGGSAAPNFASVALAKFLDRASVESLFRLAHGDHFDTVTISFVDGAATPPVSTLYYEVKLEEVYYESISQGSSAGDTRPTESVAFAFGKVTWTYYPRPTPGDPTPAPLVRFWDIRTGQGG
jgi:type VI secretion system secreted protein Hcp